MNTSSVLVGLSGGVDSSVAALLLRKEGYRVAGCTLEMLPEETPPEDGERGTSSPAGDARAAAARLGIEFIPFPCREDFRRYVMDDFVSEYAAGRTPNPCVRCNRFVKFDGLLRCAGRLGFAFIATGHYARVRYSEELRRWQLLKGLDGRKDQSYFLYPLSQEVLGRLRLPLGEYGKAAVRAMAEEAGLANARKRDSQDICFLPEGDYGGFLERCGLSLQPGNFVDRSGRVLGRHKGLPLYTTGQRKGLGIGGGEVFYVIRKNPEENTILLGKEEDLYTSVARTAGFHWVSLPPTPTPLPVTAKTRYTQNAARAVLDPEEGGVRVEFDEPQRAVTPGQALVVYQGELVVGGGTIL